MSFIPLSFKIGMVGPSKAGKTSLMTAILHETKNRLSGNPRSIQYSSKTPATKNAIDRAIAEFKVCTASGDIFAVPQLAGTESISNYEFAFTIPVDLGPSQRLDINIMDYPGGLFGSTDFDEHVRPFFNESEVLLVPIPADLLMEWKKTYKVNNDHAKKVGMAAYRMLDVNNVIEVVSDWAKRRADKKETSLLMFVPIRCEAYFNDNGGTRDESATLHEAVHQLYVDALQLDRDEDMKRNVQIEIHAVDTYGIVELRDIEYVSKNDYLVSTFKRRMCCGGTDERCELQTKGAFEILSTIIQFHLKKNAKQLGIRVKELQKAIENRGFWENLIYMFFDDKKKKELLDFIFLNRTVYEAMSVVAELSRQYPNRQRILNKLGE